VTATLYHIIDDITGTKQLNVPVEGVRRPLFSLPEHIRSKRHLTAMNDRQGMFGQKEVLWRCGHASFTDLVVKRAGIYTIQFSSIIRDMSFLVESSSFTIVRGSVHHLGVSLQPAGFRPNYAFKMQPVVMLLDMHDNLIDGDGPESTLSVTASLTPDSPKVYLAPTDRLVKPVRR
jgi:hypothetical protein